MLPTAARSERISSVVAHALTSDLTVDDLRSVHRHRLGGRKRDRLAGLQAERAAVLRALQLLLVAPHLALRQRDVGVAAHVADGVDVVVDAHDGDGDAVDHDAAHGAGRRARRAGTTRVAITPPR